ncbi:DUF3168 domain-containing protein [uncultured Ramlibacter sp.]|uniref:DUF3168 domain-containing protein n=1 Tax=uncultured Ramlibacter sp. TaxID=260755 RepID=UPI00262C2AF6|nr:DUF3168 domain-containing protein [uncultured Ramlibacter sp.]
MTFEADLTTVLKTVRPKVFPDVAPVGTTGDYLVYQGAGGQSLRYVENTPADKRNTLMQVASWAFDRETSLAMARAVEEALCASDLFTASPQSEPISSHEPETKRYGCTQRFSIYSAR